MSINVDSNIDAVDALIQFIKAKNIPKIKIAASIPVKLKENLINFNRLAPNITGIAKKKVNYAATVLDTPIIKAPRIVDPDLEVPGKTAAIN